MARPRARGRERGLSRRRRGLFQNQGEYLTRYDGECDDDEPKAHADGNLAPVTGSLAQSAAYRVEVLPPMPNFLNKNLVQTS
jgi:hypothetical protein